MRSISLHRFKRYCDKSQFNVYRFSSDNNIIRLHNLTFTVCFKKVVVIPDQNIVCFKSLENTLVLYNVSGVTISDSVIGTIITISCINSSGFDKYVFVAE